MTFNPQRKWLSMRKLPIKTFTVFVCVFHVAGDMTLVYDLRFITLVNTGWQGDFEAAPDARDCLLAWPLSFVVAFYYLPTGYGDW